MIDTICNTLGVDPLSRISDLIEAGSRLWSKVIRTGKHWKATQTPWYNHFKHNKIKSTISTKQAH